MKRHQEESRGHLLAGTTSRHDAADAKAPAPITKGCATFWVGAEEEGEAPRRLAVPVALLGHPLILELLGKAREKHGYAHQGAIVVPCGVERFQKAVDAARPKNGSVTTTIITSVFLTLPGALGPRTLFLRIGPRG